MKEIIKNLPAKTVINAETIEEAKMLMVWLNHAGYEWNGGSPYSTDRPSWSWREKSCYNFQYGNRGSIYSYKSEGFHIVTVKELMRQSMSIVSDDKLVGCLYTHNEKPYEEIVMHLVHLERYPLMSTDLFHAVTIRDSDIKSIGQIKVCKYTNYFKIEDMSLSLKVNENV